MIVKNGSILRRVSWRRLNQMHSVTTWSIEHFLRALFVSKSCSTIITICPSCYLLYNWVITTLHLAYCHKFVPLALHTKTCLNNHNHISTIIYHYAYYAPIAIKWSSCHLSLTRWCKLHLRPLLRCMLDQPLRTWNNCTHFPPCVCVWATAASMSSGGSSHRPTRCLYEALEVTRVASDAGETFACFLVPRLWSLALTVYCWYCARLELKKAYRKGALKWHPDKNVGNEVNSLLCIYGCVLLLCTCMASAWSPFISLAIYL
jgi:hypothetical protein